jgi:hypothetical protein
MGQVPFGDEADLEPQHDPDSSGLGCSRSGIAFAGCKSRVVFVLSGRLGDVEQQQLERSALALAFSDFGWSAIILLRN